jgi:hypothetical protein
MGRLRRLAIEYRPPQYKEHTFSGHVDPLFLTVVIPDVILA